MAQIQVIDLLADIGQIVRGCPVPTQVRAYVRAARRLCMETRWLRRTLDGTTVVSQPTYALGNDTYVDVIGIGAAAIEDAQSKWVPLTPSNSGAWDPDETPAQSTLYQYLTAAQFALHPTPDAIYNLKVQVVLAPKRGADSIDETLTRWEQLLEDGALGYLLQVPGVPWSNPGRGQECDARFHRGFGSVSINAETGFNPGAAPTNEEAAGGLSGLAQTAILRI